MPTAVKAFVIFFLAFTLSGCVVFSTPSPFLTAGGPETVKKDHSEVGIAVGSGGAFFADAHSGGEGWFARLRYGVCDNWDLGADVLGITHSDKGTFTFKAAARYQLATHARLEAGIGAADDSYGKSLNGDLALTVGTRNERTPWNFYTSLRLMRAQGYPGNILNGGSVSDSGAPPNTSFLLLNFGTTARISQNQKFFFEGGYGYIFLDHQTGSPGLFIGAGMLFDIGM